MGCVLQRQGGEREAIESQARVSDISVWYNSITGDNMLQFQCGDKVKWMYPESCKTESGVILSIDRWTHVPNRKEKDIKIETPAGEFRCICDLDAHYLGLEVINESR